MSAWLAVVSADHVRRAVELGVAQIGHGKRPGLARMNAGDTLIYYSPTERIGDKTALQQFTAIGMMSDNLIWQADEGDFKPFRRRVDYLPATPVGLPEVRARLHLTAGPHWGYQLRRGHIQLDADDAEVLRQAMTA